MNAAPAVFPRLEFPMPFMVAPFDSAIAFLHSSSRVMSSAWAITSCTGEKSFTGFSSVFLLHEKETNVEAMIATM